MSTGPRATITVSGKLWDANKRAVKDFQKAYVEVGVFESETEKDGTPMAMIASVHEYGAEIRQKRGTLIIPERSFLRSWVESASENTNKLMQKLYNDVASGKTNVVDAMKKLGAYASSGIRKQILDGDFVPNAPSTIAAKGSDKPLIDTGQLMNSIHYRVGKGEGAQ